MCFPDQLKYLWIVGIVSCYQKKEVIFGSLRSHPSYLFRCLGEGLVYTVINDLSWILFSQQDLFEIMETMFPYVLVLNNQTYPSSQVVWYVIFYVSWMAGCIWEALE